MMIYELRPAVSNQRVPQAEQLTWASPGAVSGRIDGSIDPWLRQLGAPCAAATDLVRLAAAAYLADRLTRRPRHFVRTIGIHVQMIDPDPWSPLLEAVADLLHWLTGDTWILDVSADATPRPTENVPTVEAVNVIALLSGGLDSFCGAILADAGTPRRFLGHADNPTIKAAQNRAYAWLMKHATPFPYVRVALSQRGSKREASSRSRSLLFLALAVAAADPAKALTVEVPENGFTSLNPPLAADRGGALSTRSTHPMTLYRFNIVLDRLGVAARVTDPYATMTKGEFLANAAAAADTSFPAGAAETLSCGKLDGARYKGGNPNQHCGLCVPCIVRRAAFLGAGLADQTVYLSERLRGDARRRLLSNRADDIRAVHWAVERGIDDVALIAAGPYPPDFDFDAALALCQRGLAELAAVPLP